MKKNIIITCILVIIVVFVIIFISNKDKKANIQILQSEVNYVEDIKNSDEENEKVENITAEQGSTVNTKIYQISTEYDGREVAIVKPSIQFKVAIAGAIKKAKPEFDEIDELLKKAPTHTGIWINSSSREQFLSLLKKITNSNYKIDDDGYLVQTEGLIMNSQDKAIKKMENSVKDDKSSKKEKGKEQKKEEVKEGMELSKRFKVGKEYSTKGNKTFIIKKVVGNNVQIYDVDAGENVIVKAEFLNKLENVKEV